MAKFPSTAQTDQFVRRLVPLVTAWAVTRVLDTPKVKKITAKVDRKALKVQDQVGKSLKGYGRHARSNKMLLAGGLAALGAAIGFLAAASKK